MATDSNSILTRLLAGNRKWSEGVKAARPSFFPETAKGQAPKVLWIGCADSRVPESVILGADPGDIFVHRNVANQFRLDDVSALSVLQYAVENVGVEHVIVTGHTGCGGANACLEGSRGRLPIDPKSTLANFLSPVIALAKELGLSDEKAHPHEDKAMRILVEENVRRQVQNIVNSDTMKKAWKDGKNVTIHGWVYILGTGLVHDLKVSKGFSDSQGPGRL